LDVLGKLGTDWKAVLAPQLLTRLVVYPVVPGRGELVNAAQVPPAVGFTDRAAKKELLEELLFLLADVTLAVDEGRRIAAADAGLLLQILKRCEAATHPPQHGLDGLLSPSQ
jgi:hypothetical protein